MTEAMQKVNVIDLLADYLQLMGINVEKLTIGGLKAVTVTDKGENWTVTYTLRETDNPRNVSLFEFMIDTPEMRLEKDEILSLLLVDNEKEVDRLSVIVYEPTTLTLDVNEILLRMLVEHPAHTLTYEVLKQTNTLKEELVDEISKLAWQYGHPTDQKMELILMYFEKKLSDLS